MSCPKSLPVEHLDRVKRIWYLSPMWAAKVQASLRIRAVSPEPSLLAHKSSESRGTFRQKARFLAPLNGWTYAVKICHDGMLEDTNSLDAAHLSEITATTLTFRVRTVDVSYYADVTLFCTWRQAGCHWLQHCFCAYSLRFVALNAIWAHCLCAKLRFHPILLPAKHAEQDQINAKWLEESLFYDERVEEQVEAFKIIVTKSIKETENLIFFFSVLDRILFHSWTQKLIFSLVASATCENTDFGVHSVK